MSFFDRAAITTVYPFTPSTYDDAIPIRYGPLGANLTPTRAEGVPIVYICTHVVSEDIAKVALHIYEDLGQDRDGRSLGKRKAPEHEWYDALHHQANEYQSALDFREMMTAWALNRGRGVARKIKRRAGGVTIRELEPLHPDCISADLTAGGDRRWLYNNPRTNKQEALLPDEVLVLWGPRRRSVIDYLRELVGVMTAGQEMLGQNLKRGPRHTGVIMRPKDAPKWNDKARENFRGAVDEYMGEGERAGRPLLLEDGMTWVNSSFSLKDTEFIAGAQLDNALVCGAYRVPQHKAGLLDRSTNNNIQQQATDYVVDCLLAWALRWEQSLRMSLLDDPFRAEHNLRSLLRGDAKTAAEVAAIYGALGWLVGNEAREDEGRNPLDGLWEPRLPLNMGNVPGTSVASVSPLLRGLLGDGGREATSVTSAHHRSLVRDAAARVVRKEVQTLTKLHERPGAWEPQVRGFYREHAEFTARVLRIDDGRAAAYCAARCAAVIADPSAIDSDEADQVLALTNLALEPEGATA